MQTKLKDVIEHENISIDAMAKDLNISGAYFRQFVYGCRDINKMKVETVIKMANYLGVEIIDIV